MGKDDASNRVPDFVLSRSAKVPASRLSNKFAAFSLSGRGDDAPMSGHGDDASMSGHGDNASPVKVTLDSVYFSSYVLNGLRQHDLVTGSFWDGTPSVLDCGDATIFAQALFPGYNLNAEIARPTTARSPAKGLFGAGMLASASNADFDLNIFDSASFVVQDWYSECIRHGVLLVQGEASDAPGRVVVGAAKVHTQVAAPALVVDNYHGIVTQIGAHVAYSQWNISLTGTAAARVVLLGSVAWTEGMQVTHTNPSIELSLIGNLWANNSANGWILDVLRKDSLATVAESFDALRELGALDLRVNFPQF